MRIGISVSSTHGGVDRRVGPQIMLERVRAAHAVGLASMSVGDHHNMAVPYVQNTPMLGRLLAAWTGRPAGALFLLPLWNPVLAAEQIGTLASIHDGPFIVQTGIGHGDEQFRAFGTDRRRRGRRLDESIRVVKALLAGETVDSPEFGVEAGRVGLLPPEPVSWWIGAGIDSALARAARVGDVWYGGPGLTLEAAADRLRVYRECCDEVGTSGSAALRRDVLVLEDSARAERLADEALRRGYRGLTREQLIVGDVRRATEQCARFAELGFDEIVMRCVSDDRSVALDTISAMGEVQAALS